MSKKCLYHAPNITLSFKSRTYLLVVISDIQRYKCKDCLCNFINGDFRNKYDNKARNLAVRMCLNNRGFCRIEEIEILEMDELFTFVKKKPKRRNKESRECSYTRIWTAVDRNRSKNIAFKVGDCDKSNFVEL